MTDRAYDSLTIDGITFDHGFNDLFEYYAHTHNGSKDTWQIFRHLHLSEASAAVWHACVCAHGLKTGATLLNGRSYSSQFICNGPLADVDATNPRALLAALLPLIAAGTWPATTLVHRSA